MRLKLDFLSSTLEILFPWDVLNYNVSTTSAREKRRTFGFGQTLTSLNFVLCVKATGFIARELALIRAEVCCLCARIL